MAIVLYKCDTCKRSIEKVENRKGLDVLGRCIVTDGCKGKLSREGYRADHIVGTSTPPAENLNDWTQRKKLHTHKQSTLSDKWKIKHDLNTNPLVHCHLGQSVYNPDILHEAEPDEITYIDENTVEVSFSQKQVGIVQLVSRTTNTTVKKEEETVSTDSVQFTSSSYMMIATLDTALGITDPLAEDLPVYTTYLTPAELVPSLTTQYTFESQYSLEPLPWPASSATEVKKVLISGKLYTIRFADIDVATLSNSNVDNGSPFFFSSDAGGTPFNEGEVYLLLTNPPHEHSSDANTEQLVDISTVTNDNATNAFFYSRGEMFLYEPTKVTIYPPIRTITT